jgi:hypothetical protein
MSVYVVGAEGLVPSCIWWSVYFDVLWQASLVFLYICCLMLVSFCVLKFCLWRCLVASTDVVLHLIVLLRMD